MEKIKDDKSDSEHDPLLIHHPPIQVPAPSVYVPPSSSSPSKKRWLALSLCCLLLFGNFYAISVQMHQYLGVPYSQFTIYLNLFYSVYSFPNIFLTLISGWLMDKFGISRVLMILGSFVCSGQILFAVGLQYKSLFVMLLGRVLFGIGAESVGVAQASITTAWFRNKELAFALGINLCVARLGSVVNAMASPNLALVYGVEYVGWVGVSACVLSFVAGAVLVYGIGMPVDQASVKYHLVEPIVVTFKDPAKRIDCLPGNVDVLHQEVNVPITLPSNNSTSALLPISEFVSANTAVPNPCYQCSDNISTCSSDIHKTLLSHEDDLNTSCALAADAVLVQANMSIHPSSSLIYNLRQLPLSFFLLCIMCIVLYPTVISFNTIASEFLQSKWYPNDPTMAGFVMSTPDTLSVVLVPIIGVMIDRLGHRCSSMGFCGILVFAAHGILAFSDPKYLSPFWAMFILGLSSSLYGTAMWPGIACVVRNASLVSTAYGAATAALNASLAVIPMIVAWVLVVSTAALEGEKCAVWTKFIPVEILFMAMAGTGCIVATVLFYVDRQAGGLLEVAEVAPVKLLPVVKDSEHFLDPVSFTAVPELPSRCVSESIVSGPVSSLHTTVPSNQYTQQLSSVPLVTPMFFHPMIRSASLNSFTAASAIPAAPPTSFTQSSQSLSRSIVPSASTILPYNKLQRSNSDRYSVLHSGLSNASLIGHWSKRNLPSMLSSPQFGLLSTIKEQHPAAQPQIFLRSRECNSSALLTSKLELRLGGQDADNSSVPSHSPDSMSGKGPDCLSNSDCLSPTRVVLDPEELFN